jgi:large subunit ribosomal protein L30
MAKSFKVKLIRSVIGCTSDQRETVRCIGLGKRESTAIVNDTPAMRGQIKKVQHLLEVSVVK